MPSAKRFQQMKIIFFQETFQKIMTSIKLNFDKSKTYAISSLSIDPNIQTGVLLLNVGEALSDKLRTYIEENKNLTLT